MLCQEHSVLKTWEKLQHEVTHIQKLKTHLHALFLAIADGTFDKSSAYRKSNRDGETNGDLQVRSVVMEDWRFPTTLPEHLSEYAMQRQIGRTLQLGFCLCMTRSWFQLYLDFQQHFPAGGPWYHQGTKQWRFSQTRLKVSFLKQVRWFNSYITKVGQQLHSRIPINPQIPDSCFISFRTKTLPVSVTEGRHLAVENILGQWSSCFATPKELSDIFDC